MKSFLLKTILFVLPVLLLAKPIDVFITNNLKKSKTYAFGELSTWNDLLSSKANSEILIYGSSRAWVHIDPASITEQTGRTAYNLGVDGHNFIIQKLRHDLIMNSKPKPKLIILSLDLFTLQKRKDLFNAEQFLPYMHTDKKMQDVIKEFEGFTRLDYQLPLLRYYGKYGAITTALQEQFITNHHLNSGRVNGYQPQDKPWNADFDKAKSKMKKYKVELDSATIILFNNFIKESRANDIKLCFVYTPEYIEGQEFVSNRDSVMQIFANYSTEFNIPFFDYSNDSISLDKKYFYNASHMNKDGADKFTKQLMLDLNKSGILDSL